MRYLRSHLGITLAVAAVLALAAMAALSQAYFLPWPSTASAQSPGDSTRETPEITSLTHVTTSSVTVNWHEADDTEVHWMYLVKADGSGGRFQTATPDSPASQGTVTPHATTVTGLEHSTEYRFAVMGVKSPSESSPEEWFSWSNRAKTTTLTPGKVSLGQDVSVAEGGTANITVTSTVAPQSPLTVNYAIGTDDDEATVDGDSADYAGSATGSVVIAAGATQGTISVVINDDSDIDDGTRETLVVTITLPEGSSHQLGENTSATVTINEGVCDRTAKVSTAILGKLSNISECAEVTDSDLSGITGALDLSEKSITAVKGRDFRGLTGLGGLRLNDNSLTALPEDVFDGLTGVTGLRLNNNSLAALPEDVFDGLTSLVGLRLNDNSLTALPEDVFDGLTSLESLRLNDNSLASLPNDVFDGLTNLESLRLNDNSLASLPKEILDGLTSLEALRLNGNSLTSLPEDVFDGLTDLRLLHLTSNTGSPFTFTAEVEQTQANLAHVTVTDAAPFDMAVSLSVTGGTLSATSVVVPAGSSESPAVTVTPSGDGPVTVSVTAASLPTSGATIGGVTFSHDGIQTGLGAATQAPEANAGADQTVHTGATVTLDASGSSDPDTSDTLSYNWKQTAGTTVTLSSTTVSGPTFKAPSSAATLTFRVTVMDGRGGSDTDTVDITVIPAPGAPANLNATAGDGRITLSWDDPSDASITGYEYRLKEGTNDWGTWTAISGSGAATVEYAKTGLTNGTAYTVEVRAVNAGGEGPPAQAGPVTPGRSPVADAGDDQTVHTGATVTLDASGSSDPGNDTLSYSWTQTAGTTVTPSSTTVSGPTFTAPSSAATLTFQVTVTDGNGGSDTDTVDITVIPAPEAPANLSATAGDGQITLSWDDPDDDSITGYEYRQKEGTSAWGEWTTIPGSGADTVEYVKTELANGTAYTMQVWAVNGGGEGPLAQAGPVTPNRPPRASAGSDQTVVGGRRVTLNASGSSDPDPGDTLHYSWRQTAGTSVTLSSTTVSGPTFTAPSSASALTFRVTVTDNHGASASDEVTITSVGSRARIAISETVTGMDKKTDRYIPRAALGLEATTSRAARAKYRCKCGWTTVPSTASTPPAGWTLPVSHIVSCGGTPGHTARMIWEKTP